MNNEKKRVTPINTYNKAKVKKKPKTYTKELESRDFMMAGIEFSRIPGYIGNKSEVAIMVINTSNIDIDCPLELMQTCMINDMGRHMPNIIKNINNFWQLTLSSNRCFLKTSEYVGFGWDIERDLTDKKKQNDISKIILKVVLYNEMKTVDEERYLIEDGWILE